MKKTSSRDGNFATRLGPKSNLCKNEKKDRQRGTLYWKKNSLSANISYSLESLIVPAFQTDRSGVKRHRYNGKYLARSTGPWMISSRFCFRWVLSGQCPIKCWLYLWWNVHVYHPGLPGCQDNHKSRKGLVGWWTTKLWAPWRYGIQPVTHAQCSVTLDSLTALPTTVGSLIVPAGSA